MYNGYTLVAISLSMRTRTKLIILIVAALLVVVAFLCTKRNLTTTTQQADNPLIIQAEYILSEADSVAEVTPNKCLELLKTIPPEAVALMDKDVFDARIQLITGLANISKGSLDEGYKQIENGLIFFENNGDSLQIADSYKKMGLALREMNKYDQSLQFLIKSLSIYEPRNKPNEVAYLDNAIGLVYLYLQNYPRTIDYLTKARDLYEKQNNSFGLAKVMNNIGISYFKMGQNIQALEFLEKALELKRRLNNNGNFANTINNIGMVCSELKLYAKAIDYFNMALKEYRQQKDKWGEANTLNNLSKIYLEMGEISKALSVSQSNQINIREVGSPDLKIEDLEINCRIQQKQKDYKKALATYIAYTTLKDSIFSEDKQRMIEEVEGKYESEKKEKEIQTLSHLREIQDTRLNMQMYIGLLLGISVLLLVVLVLILFKRYKSKKNEHNLLMLKQQEIEDKNLRLERVLGEIGEKSEQLKKQRDIAKEQKNLLSTQKEEITNSIRYASRIQRAVLESKDLNQAHLPPFFALFRPRDIVSGDFYWIRETENYSIFIVADCTGHGVPGAFMSLLGVAFLNEIISQQSIPQPNEILNSLRAKIITSLHQSSNDPINNDGMDAAILFIDQQRKKAYFSGANSDLFIARKSELIEVTGDKMPVGFYYVMQPFTTKELSLLPGDCLYLGTDGFSDQFGGPDGRKFRVKGLKNLLLQIGDKPLEQQKNILECSFDAWKGNNIQIDDVLILGIKI